MGVSRLYGHQVTAEQVQRAALLNPAPVDVIVGIHAGRVAPLLAGLLGKPHLRLVLVLGGVWRLIVTETSSIKPLCAGTDVNDPAAPVDHAKTASVTRLVAAASAVVAFTPSLAGRLGSWLDEAGDLGVLMTPNAVAAKTVVIPQSVTPPSLSDAQGPSRDFPGIRATLGLPADALVILLPAGLRAVKDPLLARDHKLSSSIDMST